MNITLISTVHEEMGKCTADTLLQILEQVRPEVIFLEALDDTYSLSEQENFRVFGVPHKRLEIRAIQEYLTYPPAQYVPVLQSGLPASFDRKYDLLAGDLSIAAMKQKLSFLTREKGFAFLNSDDCVNLHEQMRKMETILLQDNAVNKEFDDDIDAYENEMLGNIYSFCQRNHFSTAVFMCGSAHRKSIIEKIEKEKLLGRNNVNWTIYSGRP